MHRHLKQNATSSGNPPATLEYVGHPLDRDGIVTIIQYGPEEFSDETSTEFAPETLDPTKRVRWVNVAGVHDLDLVSAIGEYYGLHGLLLEDIVDTHQRPKMEMYEECVFIVIKSLRWNEDQEMIEPRQVSLVLTEGAVLSFTEGESSIVQKVSDRLKDNRGRVRAAGPDYLFYAILDAIVDEYFLVLEQIGEHLESLEEQLLDDPDRELLHSMQKTRQQVLVIRKLLWPLREVISALQRQESDLITADIRDYLRDLSDHVFRVIDTVEVYREMLSAMLEVYLSSVSNRMNLIMSVLTIIGAIFIPLTFIAGVYGMNFEYMPELHWRYAYPVVMILMGVIAGGMVWWFKRKGWL